MTYNNQLALEHRKPEHKGSVVKSIHFDFTSLNVKLCQGINFAINCYRYYKNSTKGYYWEQLSIYQNALNVECEL